MLFNPAGSTKAKRSMKCTLKEEIDTLSLHCIDLLEQSMHLESKIKYGSLSLLYRILSFDISSRDP